MKDIKILYRKEKFYIMTLVISAICGPMLFGILIIKPSLLMRSDFWLSKTMLSVLIPLFIYLSYLLLKFKQQRLYSPEFYRFKLDATGIYCQDFISIFSLKTKTQFFSWEAIKDIYEDFYRKRERGLRVILKNGENHIFGYGSIESFNDLILYPIINSLKNMSQEQRQEFLNTSPKIAFIKL